MLYTRIYYLYEPISWSTRTDPSHPGSLPCDCNPNRLPRAFSTTSRRPETGYCSTRSCFLSSFRPISDRRPERSLNEKNEPGTVVAGWEKGGTPGTMAPWPDTTVVAVCRRTKDYDVNNDGRCRVRGILWCGACVWPGRRETETFSVMDVVERDTHYFKRNHTRSSSE